MRPSASGLLPSCPRQHRMLMAHSAPASSRYPLIARLQAVCYLSAHMLQPPTHLPKALSHAGGTQFPCIVKVIDQSLVPSKSSPTCRTSAQMLWPLCQQIILLYISAAPCPACGLTRLCECCVGDSHRPAAIHAQALLVTGHAKHRQPKRQRDHQAGICGGRVDKARDLLGQLSVS